MNQKLHTLAKVSSGLLAAAAGVMCSCTLGPDYQRPALDVPTTYKGATQPAASTESAHLITNWWTLFNDPELTELEETALQENPDLKAAVERITQARAAARQVKSQFYPQITFDPSAVVTVRPGGQTDTVASIPFDLAYEVDIWGQVKRSLEAADANTRATADQLAVVEQTLEADIAQDYMNLRSLEDQERIFSENVQVTREQLDFIKIKFQGGIVGNIDLAQAQTQLDALVTQQVDLKRQRQDTEHALAILTGKAPAEFSVSGKLLELAVPMIPAEMPGDVLRHRPDVAEAEENLIAANADVGVAITNFYPTVRVTGAAGFENIDIQHTADWQSAILALGPSLSLPIFEGGRLTAELAQAKAKYRELVETYRSTILGAFRDVEVSLTDVHMFADELEAQHKAVKSAREYFEYSRIEFDQGIISTLQLLDADKTLLADEITESQLINQRLVATVLLIKAMGGGWETEPGKPIPRQ